MHAFKRGLHFTRIDRLGVISLMTSLGIALVTTIWALYLESVLGNISYVGFVTGLFTFVGIIASLILVPVIEKDGKSKIFIVSLIIFILTYLLFSVVSTFWLVILLGIIMAVTSSAKIISLGIIVRDNSKEKNASKNLGIIYTFFNIAWLLGPLIAGFVAEKYGLGKVFITAAGIILLSLILFNSFKIKDNRTSKKVDYNLIKLVIDFLKNKDRLKTYFLSGGITFWNTLVYIFIPIYIVQSSGTDLIVGYFLAAIILPLISLDYYFGKLAGKIGFRKVFFRGYLILTIAALMCFFISNLYFILVIIFLGGIGLAMLESTTESYFFDIVNKNQRDKYYGPYNTTIEFNSLLASLTLAGILLVLPFKFAFLVTAIAMGLLTILASTTKNIVESKRH